MKLKKTMILFAFFLFLTACEIDEAEETNSNSNSIITESDHTQELYYSPESLAAYLEGMASKYPEITLLKSFGKSTSGQDLWVIEISDNPGLKEMEPRIRLTGSIHGNEPISGEILILFIDYLLTNYESKSEIKFLIDNSYIAIIPILNPDGINKNTRENANGIDLNRNFSSHWVSGYDHGDNPFSEKESQAFQAYSLENNFHLSATFHSGEVIVNLPFDYDRESSGIYPEEYDLVKSLGKLYSTSGTFLKNENLLNLPEVELGTVNGGDWYIVNGSLQDWSYLETGCLDLTIELAKNNPQTEEGIEKIYNYNQESLLAYMAAAQNGIYGQITDNNDQPLPNVKISVTGGDLIVSSDSNGFYHKILWPGAYTLNFSLAGYKSSSSLVELSENNIKQEINITLFESD